MTAVTQTQNGVWYVQYRIPGVPVPKKEYFGKGELAHTKAVDRSAELETGRYYTPQLLSSRKKIYLDELGQCYLDVLKARNRNNNWINVIKFFIAVRLRSNKKVQNSHELWYKGVAKNNAPQGDFGLESPYLTLLSDAIVHSQTCFSKTGAAA